MSSNETEKENKNWFVNIDGDITDGDVLIADPCYLTRDGHKNALLMAAAPELLGFACFMRDWLLERRSMGDVCISYDEQHKLLIKIESVINKAMGS